MADRIIISFDDDDNSPDEKKNEKSKGIDITSDIPENREVMDEKIRINKDKDKILGSEISCLYKSNTEQNSFFISDLEYPSGVDKGFNLNYSIDLNDEFFSSIIYNNRFFVLTSAASKVYLIDRFNPESQFSFFIENQIFEKTGLILKNDIYLNSLRSIFCIKNTEIITPDDLKTIYTSPDDYYIWTNLNYFKNKISFVEYNNNTSDANFKLIDKDNGNVDYQYSFKINKFLYDNILITGNILFLISDNSILVISFDENFKAVINSFNSGFEINIETQFAIIRNKLFFNNLSGEIYYFDINKILSTVHYSGIRCSYLNSLAGFDNYLFAGHLSGWKLFNTNGNLIFAHNDVDENKIEALNRNTLVVSKFNKIFFHNLNRFQEAEGFAIIPEGNEKSRIISAVVSFNNIYVLTKNGIFESYSNERLNIHL